MTVFASTSCLPGGKDLWETLDRYQRVGITAIELGTAAPLARDNLAERLRAMGLDLLVHNYFPPPEQSFVLNLASPDEPVRSRSLQFVADSLQLSAELGAPFYSVHAGFVVDPVGFDGQSFAFPPVEADAAESAMPRFTASVSEAASIATSLGVRLLIENNVCREEHRGLLLLQETEEFVSFLDQPGVEVVGVLVDTGHLNVSAHTLSFDRVKFIRRLAPRIGAVHLHDNAGAEDTHDPVEAGSWALEALLTAGLGTLPVIVEAKFDTAEALARHIRWLEEQLE